MIKQLFSIISFCLFLQIVHAQVFVDYALHSTINRVQPHTGLVFWNDNSSDLTTLGNKVQLEFAYMIPADIVSDSGIYNWTKVEQVLNSAMGRGHQCILRFRYTYPGVTKPSVPLYIRNKGNYTSQILKVEGMNTFIPDWSNKELERFTLEFFTEFAKKYDTDARIAFMQVGFGSYAEYHLFDGPFEFGKTFPTKAYQKTFLMYLDSVFIHTPFNISIDAADGGTSPFETNPILKELHFGLFDDSFMHAEHSLTDDEYNRASWLFFGAERYKTNVAGGEFSYYTTYDQQHVLDVPNGPHGRSFESFVNQYHITYMIANDQIAYQTASRIQDAAMASGYQFKVVGYRSNGVVTEVDIINDGVAPIYFDTYPTLGNVKSLTSLKGLVAGEIRTCVIPAPIANQPLVLACSRLVQGQTIQYNANLSGTATSIQLNKIATWQVLQSKNSIVVKALYNNLNIGYVNVDIFNMHGQQVLSIPIMSNVIQHEFDISNLPNGIYLLRIGDMLHKLVKV